MPSNFGGSSLQQVANLVPRYDVRFADVGFVEAPADGIEGIDVQAFSETRLVTDQPP